MESEEIIVNCIHYGETKIPETISLPDFMMNEMEKYEDRTAVINAETGSQKSYRNLLQEIRELTAGLQSDGLKNRDVIAISSTNCSEYFTLLMAALRLGVAVTTANPSYTSEELIKQFNGSRTKFLFTHPERLKIMKEAQLHAPSLEKIILLPSTETHSHLETYDDLVYRGRTKSIVNLPHINPKEDMALVLYSSGTTGLPKGVVLTHYNIIANLCQMTTIAQPYGSRQNMIQLSKNDVLYAVFPYFHVGGLFLSVLWPLIQGTKIVISPKFVPDHFLDAVSKYEATILNLPPPIVVFLSKSPLVKQYKLSSVRAIVCGAASVPPFEAKSVMKRLGGNPLVLQAYGMTELSPMCHIMTATEDSRNRLNSVGVLIPNTQCKIVDPVTGKCCNANKRGEIWIRGPQVMKEYLHNPQATAQTIMPDGFLRTGDIGYYDEEGYFYVVDRLKELIKVRGFQVAPAELEGLILTHPSVADAVVIGVPDSYSGEIPRAYVIRKQGSSVSEEEIKKHIVGHVARYKELTGGVRFVQELPKTASGKPLRRVLLEEAKKELSKINSKL